MSSLTIFNTLTRQREPFVPIRTEEVGIYTCGPTVYARQHLGNLRTYLFADLLKRTLIALGHGVRHVINITDVGHLTDDADSGEDKMERAARAQGSAARELAEHWTALFQADLAALGVAAPDVWCKASEHIAEQIAMIERLEQKGFVYRLEDGLYFDTAKDSNYGQLTRFSADADRSRVSATVAKRQPRDFAVWKFSPSEGPRRQLEWQSPWGIGFPGWHIECSAMATKYLGSQFDIHTGGLDHIPVHHENEIAQSENALGVRPWVKYWMHAGWLVLGGAKLSKSSGPVPCLDDVRDAGIAAMAFRYYALTAHYRKPLEFSFEALRASERAWRRLCSLACDAGSARESGSEHCAPPYRHRFMRALCDDLNAPGAIAVLWDVTRDENLPRSERGALIRDLGELLGLSFDIDVPTLEHDSEVLRLLDARQDARRRRDFQKADALRKELDARGIQVEDTAEGQRWRRSS
jgi:cysteinyl-tRNA synthetase